MTGDSDEATDGSLLNVGVVGVGSMGRHHARIYDSLRDISLVGVADRDEDVARDVADTYGTEYLSLPELLCQADAVSVVVPTQNHYDIVSDCITAGVDVLVEKPFVRDPENGRKLIERTRAEDTVVQVGHIERFNPAVESLDDILSDDRILSIEARRLGPPRERDIDDSVVDDLMIHDIDVVLSLVSSELRSISAHSPAAVPAAQMTGNKFTTATLQFESGAVANLTASRRTHKTVRELVITTSDRVIEVDYIDQSVEIYRNSMPEYVEMGSDVRYRHESVIEVPYIENKEPLKNEISTFVSVVQNGDDVPVPADEGLRAVEIARRIDARAMSEDK